MTIPNLMNCSHSDTGWCLECVGKMYDAHEAEAQGLADEILAGNRRVKEMFNHIRALAILCPKTKDKPVHTVERRSK